MDARTRVLKAVRRESQAALPIQLDMTDRALTGVAAAWGFALSEERCRAALRHDLVFARPAVLAPEAADGRAHVDAWGVAWASDHEGAWVARHPIGGSADLRGYRLPDVRDRLDWAAVADTARRHRGTHCVVGYHNCLLFERAWSLCGFERLLFEMATDPGGVEALLTAITECQIDVAEAFVAAGVDLARTGDDWGGQTGMLFAPETWRRLIRPRLQAVWQVYQRHGIPIIHHSCGDIRPILGDLVDLGLAVLHPVQPEAMPLDEVAARYGAVLSFYGGISEQAVLSFGTPDAIRHEVRRCVELLGARGGYILAPSQAILSDVSPENVRVLLDAMISYSQRRS